MDLDRFRSGDTQKFVTLIGDYINLQSIKNLHMTDLTTFQDCRKRFYYEKVLRIVSTSHNQEVVLSPDTDSRFHLTFGTIGHKCLHEYYADRRPLLESFAEYGSNLCPEYYEIGQSLFEEYESEYSGDFDDYEILLVETPIRVDFPMLMYDKHLNPKIVHQPIDLTIDVLVKSKNNGAVFAMDHKFLGAFSSYDELVMRDQFTGYVAAVREAGVHVDGVICNTLKKIVVRNPRFLNSGGISVDKSQSTTYRRYLKFVEVERMGGAECSKYDGILEYLRTAQHPSLRRDVILKTSQEIDVWKRNLKPRLWDIAHALRNVEHFYPNPGRQCNTCEYCKVCKSQLSGGTGEGYITTMYREKMEDER